MTVRAGFSAVAVIAAGLGMFGGMAAAQSQLNFGMPGEADARSKELIAEQQKVAQALTPVTDADLETPPAEDWLNWRRTYNGWGYSPLDQIDRKNVDGLRLVWSWAMASGPTNGTPLVHEGVMFVQNYGDAVEALDAATGDLLWRWSERLPRGKRAMQKKAMAIYGTNIYAATSDNRLVALDMKTGQKVWEAQVGKDGLPAYMTGGPVAVKGKIIVGMSGCASTETGGCFIAAFDAKTGAEAWRFNTTTQPDDPTGDTWNGIPAGERLGGSVWIPGTYDAELDLVYFGAGQPYPWSSYVRGTSPQKPGMKNNALFTNSTLALDPDTGELKWYYQHLPNDSWDMDYAFERQIIEAPVDGRMRKLVVTSGKMAIIEALDAKTGEFVFAKDLGLQTLVKAIDPKTGEKTIDRSLDPEPGKTVHFCPHAGGARSWPGVGWDPESKTMFLPLQMHCAEYQPYPLGEDGEFAGGNARWRILPPKNGEGFYGRLDAVDFSEPDHDWAWQHKDRAPQSTASLPTGGGIVFQGTYDRYFRAHDERTGKILWQTRLSDVPNSYPVTFEVDGRQYVAVLSGSGGPYTRTWGVLMPDIAPPAESGATLWVFALPDRR